MRMCTVVVAAIVSSSIALPAAASARPASAPPAEPAQAFASDEADADAWRRYERKRRRLVAGVAVSASIAGVGLAMLAGAIAAGARDEGPYVNYTVVGVGFAGGVLLLGGAIAMPITGVMLDNHENTNRPPGAALGRARLQPGAGGITLRF